MTLAFIVCSVVTAVSAAVSFGYSVAGLRGSRAAARTASSYALARSLALLVGALLAPFTNLTSVVALAALLMVLVQLLDAAIGARLRDRVKSIGPAATALVNAVVLGWMIWS
jgi:diacylglycerol kinase